jgi:hypothetical protein
MWDGKYTNTDEKPDLDMNLHMSVTCHLRGELGTYVLSPHVYLMRRLGCAGSDGRAEGEPAQRWATVQSGGGLLGPTRAEVVARAVQSGGGRLSPEKEKYTEIVRQRWLCSDQRWPADMRK